MVGARLVSKTYRIMRTDPYLALKSLHLSCVALSYTLFVIRGIWMINRPVALRRRWVRIVPHLVDTVLLGSGVGLMLLVHQYPLTATWLTAKLVALLGYIFAGMVAFRFGRSLRLRIGAWIAAQTIFAYIVAVAITRSPLILW